MKRTRQSSAVRGKPKRPSPRGGTLDVLEPVIGGARKWRELTAQATLNAMAARLVYEARAEAGMTQGRLAKKIGSRQPAISRVENANGQSLSMLRRISRALGKRLEVRLARAMGMDLAELARALRRANAAV
ncbi:MAG: helix-turn-helix transcriptional regulator [Tepidisphaerales bacterium]